MARNTAPAVHALGIISGLLKELENKTGTLDAGRSNCMEGSSKEKGATLFASYEMHE